MENIELAVITNIIDASDRTFGFAKLASTGEQAYLGPNIFRQKSLELGATIYCDIAQNDSRYTDRGCNKRIIFVYDEDGPFAHLLPKAVAKPVVQPAPVDEVVEVEVTSQMIRDYVELYLAQHPYFFTTSEICDFVNEQFPTVEWTAQKAGPYLEQIHRKEKITQISALTNPKNSKKSKVAWCHNKHWLALWSELFEDE